MKALIVVNITEESLQKSGLSVKQVMDTSLSVLADFYEVNGLKFDCGYNPELITRMEA